MGLMFKKFNMRQIAGSYATRTIYTWDYHTIMAVKLEEAM